jgi:hypothetical protein
MVQRYEKELNIPAAIANFFLYARSHFKICAICDSELEGMEFF